MTPEEVPDTVTIEVRPGATVLITSDLHFAAERTQSSAWAEEEISQALDQTIRNILNADKTRGGWPRFNWLPVAIIPDQ